MTDDDDYWETMTTCPNCNSERLSTNGDLEWCPLCGYSRTCLDAPLESEDAA